MKREFVFSIITVFLITNLVSALVSFQRLGTGRAESYAGGKYRSADNQIRVGRALAGTTDIDDVELASATPFNPHRDMGSGKVAFRCQRDGGLFLGNWNCQQINTLYSGWSAANAISSDGSTIVGYTGDGLDVVRAFRWTESGGAQILNHESELGIANDISDNGLIVGNSTPFQGMQPRACLWEDGDGYRDLQGWLGKNYNLWIHGWTLTDAIAISADGTTIAGYGINPDGIEEDWVVTIPEPATLSLLVLGAVLLRRKSN